MQLNYRSGTPLYSSTLRTVLSERPCRVIVAAEPTPAREEAARVEAEAAEEDGGGGVSEGYRLATRFFSLVIIGFGVAIVVVTLANGGGAFAFGILIGIGLHRDGLRPALARDEALGGARMSENGERR